MMRILNVDKSALFSLVDIGTKTLMTGEIKFERDVEEDEEDYEITYPKYKNDDTPYYILKIKESHRVEFTSFDELSPSQQKMLILDLQITKAREIAKQRLTLLLIEELALSLDFDNFTNLLEILKDEEFQVIVSLPLCFDNKILNIEKDDISLKDLSCLEQWHLEVIGQKN